MTTDLLHHKRQRPSLGAPGNPDQINSEVVGTITIDFTSVQSATMRYTAFGKSGSLKLEPFEP